MKILIVSAFFPPMNSIAGGRPYSWAKYWSQAGHDVTVLTVQRAAEASDSPLPTDGFRVVRTPLPQRGRQRAHSTAASAVPSVRAPGLLRRLWRALKARYGIMSAVRMPDEHDRWVRHAIAVVCHDEWDVVVTTGGPYSVHFVGRTLKRSGAARRWCVDWRDLWTRNSLFPGLPGVRWLERCIEATFHRECDMVTTVSPPLAEMLRSMCDAPVHVVYNGFDPDDGARLAPESIFPADGVFRVAYTGTLYPVRQDPTPFFAALAHLQRERIVGPGTFEVVIAGACAPLLDIAERFGVRALVTHRGMLTKSDALRMQRDAQALLLIGFRGAGQEGVLSGKIFEYLSAGPPVLAVTADESSSIGEMLHETGRGVALGSSVEAIAAQLRAWIAQSHAARRGDSNVLDERVLRYTRERQAMQLLEILQPRLSGAYADG